jgi:hypothetical protein
MTKIDTAKIKDELQRELDGLCRIRDELRLQSTLARAEVRGEWERLEQRLALAQEELGRLSSHGREVLVEVQDALRSLLDELKAGYERIQRTS